MCAAISFSPQHYATVFQFLLDYLFEFDWYGELLLVAIFNITIVCNSLSIFLFATKIKSQFGYRAEYIKLSTVQPVRQLGIAYNNSVGCIDSL